MAPSLSPFELHWRDVEPGSHPFDPAEARSLVSGVLRKVLQRGDDRTGEITVRLADHFGRWVCGWRWARDEGDIGGGPVITWCCVRHSYWPAHEPSVDPTAERILSSLGEWRGWIETLGARFDALAPSGRDELPVAFEIAAAALIADVAVRTRAGDAWYVHTAQVLAWYLERHGVGDEASEALVSSVLEGRFASWSRPDDALVREVSTQLGAAVQQWSAPAK